MPACRVDEDRQVAKFAVPAFETPQNGFDERFVVSISLTTQRLAYVKAYRIHYQISQDEK